MTEKLAAEIVKKSGIMRDTGMTSATPKSRAGEHTKGPWRAGKPQGGSGLVWADGVAVADCLNGDGSDDARRIVACVNACEGIEGNPPNVAELIETLHRAMVERDLLRERERELVEVMRALTQVGTIDGNVVVGPRGWELVQAALKKVKS